MQIYIYYDITNRGFVFSSQCQIPFKPIQIIQNTEKELVIIIIIITTIIVASVVPMADAICGPPISCVSDHNLWHFGLKIALPVAPGVGNVSSKFERCTVFRCRVNDGHGQTTGGRMSCDA